VNIFVQKQDSKFINNIILTLRHMGIDVISTDINNDLYKIYHNHQFSIGIFLASKFNNETAQFVSEFYSKQVKSIIYHDIDNTDVMSDFSRAAHHLSHNAYENTTTIPKMINNHLYKNLGLVRRKSAYALFLDHRKNIPDNIIDILYPNTKLHINMFNSEHVSHHQNLGKVSEIDKANILNSYEFFIDINGDYSAEAVECGAKLISVDQIKLGKKTKITNKIDPTITTYETFIRSNLL
jgi:hypothetical protein